LFYIATYIDCIPILLFLFFFNKTKKEKGLWAIILSSFISFLIIGSLSFFPRNVQHYLLSAFTFFEYTLFAYFLGLNLNRRRSKKVLLYISIAFTLFLFIYSYAANFKKVDTVNVGVETIIIIIFSFYFLYQLMNENKVLLIYNDYRFWIILGMVIYLAGSFFIYIYADQLSASEMKQFWFLTWIFYILKGILFSIAILIFIRQYEQNKQTNKTIPYLDLT